MTTSIAPLPLALQLKQWNLRVVEAERSRVALPLENETR
jgi:hypothetical protein